jgi:hypothetical protein
MRRFIWIPICVLALVVPVIVLAGSEQTGFDGVVNSIESRYHVHAQRIPFMGVISLIARKASNESVSGMHVAEFENFPSSVDGEELNSMIEEKLGQGWDRVVRETSKRGHEQTLVFMRPEGDRMGLFVLDLNRNELDVVQISVDPEHLNDQISRYRHQGQDRDDAPAHGMSD